MRKFEVLKEYENINIPKRATKDSAGYDIEAAEDTLIKAGEIQLVKTGLRVKMPKEEVVLMFPRSSLAFKKGLMMSNGVGVIDSDYYYADNKGHIMVPLYNFKGEDVLIKKHERIAQAIFTNFYKTTDEKDSGTVRLGGFGSSGI